MGYPVLASRDMPPNVPRRSLGVEDCFPPCAREHPPHLPHLLGCSWTYISSGGAHTRADRDLVDHRLQQIRSKDLPSTSNASSRSGQFLRSLGPDSGGPVMRHCRAQTHLTVIAVDYGNEEYRPHMTNRSGTLAPVYNVPVWRGGEVHVCDRA